MVNLSNVNGSDISVIFWQTLPFYFLWIIQFFVIGIANFVITAAILRFEALRHRKEYIVLLGLLLADGINFTAYLFAGIYRSLLVIDGQHDMKISTIACLKIPHICLFSFSDQLASLMLVVVSLDRLISVSSPLRYLGFGTSYAYMLIGTSYGYCMFMGALGLSMNLVKQTQDLTPAPCFTGPVARNANKLYGLYFAYITPFMAFVSVPLYGVVLLIYKRTSVPTNSNREQEQERKRQRNLTTSFGISAACTLGFYVIPSMLGHTIRLLQGPQAVGTIMFALCNFNSLCNVIIFLKRDKILYKAVISSLRCKTMPSQLSMWHAMDAAQTNKINAQQSVREHPETKVDRIRKLSVRPEQKAGPSRNQVWTSPEFEMVHLPNQVN